MNVYLKYFKSLTLWRLIPNHCQSDYIESLQVNIGYAKPTRHSVNWFEYRDGSSSCPAWEIGIHNFRFNSSSHYFTHILVYVCSKYTRTETATHIYRKKAASYTSINKSDAIISMILYREMMTFRIPVLNLLVRVLVIFTFELLY